MSCSDSSFTAYLTSCRWMGCLQWNKLKYTYFVFFLLVMGKLTPRLCWLLQWWNYCCVIALDRLACAEFKEFKEFNEHKVELNLTWPMVKSTAEWCTCNISAFQLKFNHQKGCLSLSWSPSSDTMFYLWVVATRGSWMGTVQFCMRLNGAEWGICLLPCVFAIALF